MDPQGVVVHHKPRLMEVDVSCCEVGMVLEQDGREMHPHAGKDVAESPEAYCGKFMWRNNA